MTAAAAASAPISSVLVVDDSAFARQGAILCLRSAGLAEAEYHEAANGREALEFLRQTAVELVVTDLNMPDMDGRELLTTIKSDAELAPLRVLVVSSLINDTARAELVDLGAVGVATKPLSGARAMSLLRSLVNEG